MDDEIRELRTMLDSASRAANGWCALSDETARRLNWMMEYLMDRLEEAKAVALTLALTVKVNFTEDQREGIPGMTTALKQFDNFMFGDKSE